MYKIKISESKNKKKYEELDSLKGYIDNKLGLISSSKITMINIKNNLKEVIKNKFQIKKENEDLNKDNINNLDEICDDFARYGLEPEQFIDKILINSTDINISEYSVETICSEISRVENAIKLNKHSCFDYDVTENYRRKEVEYIEKIRELNGFTSEKETLKIKEKRLKKQRLHDFMTGFNEINLNLKEIYQMITFGGDAELEILDPLDPFTEGINLSIRPPNKSWKIIVNLSGGEKTISSLSLVLAFHQYRPTPFYVLDEIDAALDFKNVSIVGHYIKDLTHNAQFVIISLHNNMFELANRLIGICKIENSSKSINLELENEI
jgi:structural maintenance of chromosome 4